MRCAIWYHLYNLKQATLSYGCFSRILICKNGAKSHKTSNRCAVIYYCINVSSECWILSCKMFYIFVSFVSFIFMIYIYLIYLHFQLY